jgi:hypothetical protein
VIDAEIAGKGRYARKRAYIHLLTKSTDQFPIQKCAIFCKFKEIGGIARGHTIVRRTSDYTD